MQTISEIVVPVTMLFLTLLVLWLFCRTTCTVCDKLYETLCRIIPQYSVPKACEQALGVVLWITMVGAIAWFMRDELKINNEQLFAFLSIWSLAIVIFAVLLKVLPDGIFKRVCGWTFLAVAFGPPLGCALKFPWKAGGTGAVFGVTFLTDSKVQAGGCIGVQASKKEKREKSAAVKNKPPTGKIRNL